MKINKFETKLIETLKKYDMIRRGDSILVGLSGGKDSVALLYSLHKISNYFGFKLNAFHLNHCIRGEEADRDQLLAEEFAKSLDVPIISKRVDVISEAEESTIGLEAVARNVRYREIDLVASDMGCNKIATAHTLSDNSETALITLSRNSNLKGIPPVRGNIIRPLIEHSTQEVLDYCNDNGLSYATDSTNALDDYTRNYIRHNVLPGLRNVNPSFDESVMRFSRIQRSNNALIDREVDRYYKNTVDPLSLKQLESLAKDEAYHNVLYSIISKESEKAGCTVAYKQFDSVISMILSGTTGSEVCINESTVIKRNYERLVFDCAKKDINEYCFELKHGENPIPNSNVSMFLETLGEYEQREKNEHIDLKFNKLTKNSLINNNIINRRLYLRSRKNGDSYVCRGIDRSIKKYMIDIKIPADQRNNIPILCDFDGIVWVPGLGIADRVKAEADSGELLSLSIDFKTNDC